MVICVERGKGANGRLVRETDTGQRIVRHEPNLSWGGRVTETPVEEWLDRTGTSPENVALRALLEKLGGERRAPVDSRPVVPGGSGC